MKIANVVLEMDRPRFIVDPSIYGLEDDAAASGIRVFPNENDNYPVVETTLREWDTRAGQQFIERVNDDEHGSGPLNGGSIIPKFFVKEKSLFKRESEGDPGQIVGTFESEEAAACALDELQFKDAKANGPLFFDRLSDAQNASNRYSDIVWSITEEIATIDNFASPWNRHMLHDELAKEGVTGAFIRFKTWEAVAAHYENDEQNAQVAVDLDYDYLPAITDEMDKALGKTCVQKLLPVCVALKWVKAKIQYEEEDDDSDW